MNEMPPRLLELAKQAAATNHWKWRDDHAKRVNPGHVGGLTACLHLDCVLVRRDDVEAILRSLPLSRAREREAEQP